jgi:rhamnogalacturonan exolyase
LYGLAHMVLGRICLRNKDEDDMTNNRETSQSLKPTLEDLGRGFIGIHTDEGNFLTWRIFKREIEGKSRNTLHTPAIKIYKNGSLIAEVKDCGNYLDASGTENDFYEIQVGDAPKEPLLQSIGQNSYIEIPIQKPGDGTTPIGDVYTYSANDMSVGDADGDGEYEFYLKWDPSNSHDVSHSGYTGNCYIDCYKLSGQLLWRLDLGPNIRAGAHYTQFMVMDFDGDGKAEMSVKTAPGSNITRYDADGRIISREFITLPQRDIEMGINHESNFVCSKQDYLDHLVQIFKTWQEHPMVASGQWPKTLEECFGLDVQYTYPLQDEDAKSLVDYFVDVYAPMRSTNNKLRDIEGFIYEGPEYLTMFSGDGQEIETIDFPFPRQDDGLMWGDYAMPRIEPCNRVDRFLSGVAYLDGVHPHLVICRGYYTRTTITAYLFQEGKHQEVFRVDSGHVLMSNPFQDGPHEQEGSDPVYGTLAGQGNHSLSVADIDQDGYQEIIYGAAIIDHDGTLYQSLYGELPNGERAKLGHGDALHVGKFDPKKPGYQIFSVFEGAQHAPYGFAFRDAKTGEIFFGEYAEEDLGRAMVGEVSDKHPGFSLWVRDMFDLDGNKIDEPLLGTNMSIRFKADCSTQIIDGVDYQNQLAKGVISDIRNGIILEPQGTLTNNGTKGNPCLVADIWGDYREELILRTEDSTALRIYTSTEVSDRALFTLMEDAMYRVGVAWQNNCYNQPCYPSFYYGSDMDFRDIEI